jgi:hypothetical protein
MGTYTTQWEDDDNNRILELSVQYRMDGSDLEIVSVTPATITFLNPGSRVATRRIGVHTATGRELLLRQFAAAVGYEQLQQEMAATI